MTGQNEANREDKIKQEADAARALAQTKSAHVQKVINRIRSSKAKRLALRKSKPELNQ